MQVITIPNYIRTIRLSEARQKKYYELGKVAPKAKKYQDSSLYEYRTWPGFKNRKFLVDITTGERVLANPKAAGTPRELTINGQKIYNGEVGKHVRNKVLSDIKKSFEPYIAQLKPITKFPIRIECEIHDVIRDEGSNSLWDMDNRAYPYIKAFQDCLTGNKDKSGNYRSKRVLADDNILYITQPPVPLFVPINPGEERKLIFIIKEEEDIRILLHRGYRRELDNLQTLIGIFKN